MRKIISLAAALFLTLGGCSYIRAAEQVSSVTVSAEQLNTARQTVLAMRHGYNLGVVVLARWVDQPRCPKPDTISPICTTRAGIIAVAKAQDEMGAALRRVEAIVVQVQPDAKALSVAMDAARAAYATFQSVQASYGSKP